MTATAIYVLTALLIVVLGSFLTRRDQKDEVSDIDFGRGCVEGVWDGPGLSLAERIFDSADYLWLRDEINNPRLARILARSRRQMALRWLKALRKSFDDLVRLPEPISSSGDPGKVPSAWQLLWLTLRFHCLLRYAMMAVRVFGPYHRLVPSLNWMPPLAEPFRRKTSYRTAHMGDAR